MNARTSSKIITKWNRNQEIEKKERVKRDTKEWVTACVWCLCKKKKKTRRKRKSGTNLWALRFIVKSRHHKFNCRSHVNRMQNEQIQLSRPLNKQNNNNNHASAVTVEWVSYSAEEEEEKKILTNEYIEGCLSIGFEFKSSVRRNIKCA